MSWKNNDCVTKNCGSCIFYTEGNDMSCHYQSCLLVENGDGYYGCGKGLRWVSATDCEKNPKLKREYIEQCEYFTDIKKIRSDYRKKYGFEQ